MERHESVEGGGGGVGAGMTAKRVEDTLAKCAICGTTQQLLRCAKCKTTYYCSTTHQHIHWPNHKLECRLIANNKQKQITSGYTKIHQLQQAVASTMISIPTTTVTTTANKEEANLRTNETLFNDVSRCSGGVENKAINNQMLTLTSNSMDNKQQTTLCNSLVSSDETTQQDQFAVPKPRLDRCCPNKDVFSNRMNGQNEKSASYLISHNEENVGNTNERRYEELCRNIISDMNQYGLSVVDDFLGMEKGLKILNEVHRMYSAGVFQDGQLVNNMKTDQHMRTIRGDKITWIKGVEPGCLNVGYLINQIDAVICRANAMNNNGKLGEYTIRERTKAMIACYPGSGSHYVMHVDNPNKDGRVITAIYYLNVNWDTRRSGGMLRIFPEHGNSIADIEPKFDRLIFFWSDKRNPHEVQPAHRTRYAITVWYFDASEREAALNRCKTDTVTETTSSKSTLANKTLMMTTNNNTSSVSDNNHIINANLHHSSLNLNKINSSNSISAKTKEFTNLLKTSNQSEVCT